jgi:hypothetical protein
MSIYAIPGLMTAPVSPKSDGRFRVSPDGALDAEVYWSNSRSANVGFSLIRRLPGGEVLTLVDDPKGLQLLRVRDGEGCSYRWKVTPGAYSFPAGDLELWVKTPEDPRKVFSVFVDTPTVQTSAGLTFVYARPREEEVAFGLFDLPLDAETVTVPIAPTLSVAPVWFMLSVVDTEVNPVTVYVILPTVVGYSTSSLQVALSSRVPKLGLKLSWRVSTTLQESGNLQRGTFQIPPNTASADINFAQAFASTPMMLGTKQSGAVTPGESIDFVFQNVTTAGFRVALSSAVHAGFTLSWQASV